MDKLFDRIKKKQKENNDIMTDIERRDWGPWVIRKKKQKMFPDEFILFLYMCVILRMVIIITNFDKYQKHKKLQDKECSNK